MNSPIITENKTLKTVLSFITVALLVVALILLTRSAQQPAANGGIQPNQPTLPGSETAAAIEARLDGTNYQMSQFNGTRYENSPITLGFQNGRLSAKFCNTIGGSYAISEDVISAELVSTLMYCEQPEGLMVMESRFSTMLSEGAIITENQGIVTITGNSGNSFVFTLQAI